MRAQRAYASEASGRAKRGQVFFLIFDFEQGKGCSITLNTFLFFGNFQNFAFVFSFDAVHVMSDYSSGFGSSYRGSRRSSRYRLRRRRSGRIGAVGRRRYPYSRYGRGAMSRYRGAMYGAAASRAVRFTNANATGDELKYLDTNSASYQSGTTGSVTLINGIAAGSTSITREGRQCFWRQVIVSGSLVPNDATVIGSRNDLFVIWDKQHNETLTIVQIHW